MIMLLNGGFHGNAGKSKTTKFCLNEFFSSQNA